MISKKFIPSAVVFAAVVWQAVCVKMFYPQTGTFFLPYVRVSLTHVRVFASTRTYQSSYVRVEVSTYVWKLVCTCGS